MATLVLGIAGGALGSAFGPAGAILGRAAGALAGYTLDQMLFGTRRRMGGPRPSDLEVQASTEGAPIPRIYGRARIAGEIIWATKFEEVRHTENEGGKGGPQVSSTTFSYFANFAVGLCEGQITRIGRIWADGKPLDQAAFAFRVYRGGESQAADSLIVAKEGSETPAYRGTAYVVFERMPLAEFGNRIPQLSFEVFRAIPGIEEHVRAVCVIPGSTEFGYDSSVVTRSGGEGVTLAENAHVRRDASDWTVSIDELQALCPNLEWVTLIVAWFGDDLRANACTIRPKVDDATKATSGATWQVSGLTRATAEEVTKVDGRAAYGGSPCDLSVIRAIEDLKERGLKVLLAPFVLMDIPAGNSLPNPETGGTGQPAYPWRGRITCWPAPGRPGSPDKTSAATTQVTAFLGAAAPGDFSAGAGGVLYSGPAEWSFRRMILHYARLAEMAGGVDAMLIGSELVGLTTLRSSGGSYPFVTGLRTLASDVRAIVGAGTAISYAADWSEYFGHQPADGSGDVHFHLDPLWSDAEIDFVGIDLYHPLTDWRDDPGHVDEVAGRSPYNLNYLRSNVRGGEGFDWYYASAEDRAAQVRTPITDGAHAKPWMFRFKDIEAWWGNAHYNRPAGVEAASPTGWTPQSKPIWLTELGCPAVDKGANQPNVFFDPKSAQSALPHFSSGARDDFQQRAYVEAYQRFFDTDHPEFDGSNPVSPVYGGRMVPPAHMHRWAWDARPYPYFPDLTDVWGDGPNWERGHWLNGRLGNASLAALIEAVLRDHKFSDFAVADAYALLGGYLVNDVLSARGTLEPLIEAFRVNAADAGDRVLFRGLARPADVQLDEEALVEKPDQPLIARRRAQETELASELVLRFIDPGKDYRLSTASSRRLVGESNRGASLDLSAIMEFSEAERLTDTLLRDVWAGRERADIGLPPSLLAVEAGDLLMLPGIGQGELLLAERIEDAESRSLALRRIDGRGPPAALGSVRERPDPVVPFGKPAVRIIDFAPPDGDQAQAPRLAVFADPWPGTIAVYGATEGGGFRLLATVRSRATIGKLLAPLAPGPFGLFDRANAIEVELLGGALASLPEIDVLGGGNAAAVKTIGGDWEALQFSTAELIGPRRYRLTRLLRGQCGTEQPMATGAATGADFVLLDRAVASLPVRLNQLALPLRYRFGPARDDHAAPAFLEQTITAQGEGLRPFAPVQLRAHRNEGSGDVALSWLRRTRFGGLGLELTDVPLNEEREAYRLEILDGPDIVRTVETTTPAYSYSAPNQTTDFGLLPSGFSLRLAQLSATVGAGRVLEAAVSL
jgi:hypothetical protein